MAKWKKVRGIYFEDDVSHLHLFIRALDRNDITVVRKYLKMGIDPNSSEFYANTGLHIASENNYYNLVQILLTQPKININVQNNFGCTPLFLACARNHINIVKLLIRTSADLNLANKFGYTPLHESVLKMYYDVVEILLENGAEVNLENIYGKTPLYHAVLDNPSEVITDILVRYGANVNLNNGVSMPILLDGALICQSYPQIQMLELLLYSGAYINIRDVRGGFTALHMVAISSYVPLAEVLIENGANYNLQDYQRRTPLDVARRHENHKIIQFFEEIIRKSQTE